MKHNPIIQEKCSQTSLNNTRHAMSLRVIQNTTWPLTLVYIRPVLLLVGVFLTISEHVTFTVTAVVLQQDRGTDRLLKIR